ncbi:MAG: hypothetical protein AAF567_24425 [Actinomycetota bacterium]
MVRNSIGRSIAIAAVLAGLLLGLSALSPIGPEADAAPGNCYGPPHEHGVHPSIDTHVGTGQITNWWGNNYELWNQYNNQYPYGAGLGWAYCGYY